MNTYVPVVLAAGKGTRMRSSLSKLLHPLAGQPLLSHVLDALDAIPSTVTFAPLHPLIVPVPRPVVVVGHESQQITTAFGDRCLYATQHDQLGTGHAVLAAQSVVDVLDPLPQIVLVCYGDTPLVRSEMLASVLVAHIDRHATLTFLTAHTERSSDYGRVVRDSQGRVREIVEVKRATPEQLLIQEVNSGVYCFDRAWLWSTLQALPRNPSGEYYLTDLIAVASAQEQVIATVSGDLEETLGINNRVQLAEAEAVMRLRIARDHMYNGVTIVDPANTYIDRSVLIGPDTTILPGTILTGATSIGAWCRIGPDTTIDQSTIGDRCTIKNSVIESARVEHEVAVGPFCHLRAGAHLAHGVRMGNFGEVKNSYVGAETDMHHFSYLGDATVGERVNIAAGTITSNYNSLTRQKYPTTIGSDASIGSDSILVAPITIGEGAMTGSGAVVNKDVPPHALVVGVPARLLRMLPGADDSTATANENEKE